MKVIGKGKRMDSVKEGIRLNLIDLLAKKNRKKIDLANACGVSPASVTGWVKSGSIDVERIPAICDFFGITVSEFFGRSEKFEPPLHLTRDEKELMMLFRMLPEAVQHAVLAGFRDYALSQPTIHNGR